MARTSDETREAILDAAVALFSERSFRDTTLAAVADRAGVTDAGILYHFGTKRDLLIAALRHADRRYEEEMQGTLAVGGLAALRALGQWGGSMERDAQISALHVMLSAESLTGPSEAHTYFVNRYRALRRAFEALFRQAVENGELRADLDPSAEASALIAHMDGIRLQWFFGGGRVSMAESIERYVDTMLARLVA